VPSPHAIAVQGIGFGPQLVAVQGFGELANQMLSAPDETGPDPYAEVQQRLAQRRRIQRQNSLIVQLVMAAVTSGVLQ